MSDTPSTEQLQTRIAVLEAENVRLRRVEAAAKEAGAVLEGRRPGFGIDYVKDFLRAALEAGEATVTPFPTVRGGWNARRRRGPRER